MIPAPPPSPAKLFNLADTPSEMFLPFIKAPLIAYQESETAEQRVAWLFRAIADLNSILACHEEACKKCQEQLKKLTNELQTLQESIAAERAERIAADQELQDNIDAEAQAREAADQALQNGLDAEIANRKAADTTLRNRIATEETARAEADQALDGRISTLETKCANGECGGSTPPAQKTIDEYMSEILTIPLFKDYNAGSSVIDGIYELATYHLEYDFTDAPYTDEEIADYFSDKKILVNVKFNCNFQNVTANNKAYELSMSLSTDEVAEKKKVYAISPYIEAGMISRTFFDGSTLYTPSINGRRVGINQLYVDVKCTAFSSEFVPLYDAMNHLLCTVQVVSEPIPD